MKSWTKLALTPSALRSFRLSPALVATMASADSSQTLVREVSPSKVCIFPNAPPGCTVHVLDGFRVSLSLASSPPMLGLSAGSCPCGRRFACCFLQLRLAATPCSSATVGAITSGQEPFILLDTAHVGRTSGRVQRIAPLHPPTPPDIPFSVSGDWNHTRWRTKSSGVRKPY